MKRRAVKFIHGRVGLIAGLAALVFFVSGCLDNKDDNVQPVPVGYVSLYHAAPNAPGLDISVDNRKINSQPFDYSSYSGYLNFYTGNRHVTVSAVNANNALADTTIDVQEGKAYSVFIINRFANIETLVVRDSAAIPASGKAMVRFVQLSPDAPALDVKIAGSSGDSWFTNAPFKQASAFKEVDASTYSFEIHQAGSSDVLATVNSATLNPGGYYTIVARGFVNPPSGNTNVFSVEIL
jgi:hypothetical protein